MIEKIPVARLKFTDSNTKKVVRVAEKHVRTIVELFITFNSNAGWKFDGFGRTIATIIVCLNTGRPCVFVQMDGHCFDLAVAPL